LSGLSSIRANILRLVVAAAVVEVREAVAVHVVVPPVVPPVAAPLVPVLQLVVNSNE
jgi:hypothetical protein